MQGYAYAGRIGLKGVRGRKSPAPAGGYVVASAVAEDALNDGGQDDFHGEAHLAGRHNDRVAP